MHSLAHGKTLTNFTQVPEANGCGRETDHLSGQCDMIIPFQMHLRQSSLLSLEVASDERTHM